MARHIFERWKESWKTIGAPLTFEDWLKVQCSALLFPGRLCLQGAQGLVERSREKEENRLAKEMKVVRRRSGAMQDASVSA